MASIFTYEHDTPEVRSPWLDAILETGQVESSDRPDHGTGPTSPARDVNGNGTSQQRRVSRLCPEPQQGPVEYKLHLLLRPRRKFRSISTSSHISGSRHSRVGVHHSNRSVSETALESSTPPGAVTPPSATTIQGRQHRLQQLTTQLLWRLQQSSPRESRRPTPS